MSDLEPPVPAISGLPGHRRDLAETTLAWSDQLYDTDRGLVWSPPGGLAGTEPRVAHLVPQSAWYAAGLLLRDGPGDRARALAVFDAVLATQLDAPTAAWHGTFPVVAEAPPPGGDNITEWVDYDPNMRQFVATTLLLVLRSFEADLPAPLVRSIDTALGRAAWGEPADRVAAWYTNIAIMRSLVDVEAGARFGNAPLVDRGHALALEIADRFRAHGAFDEFGSPTYYGTDLFGLALWRTCPASERLREWGSELTAGLWRSLSASWHAGLDNPCGPYTRAYGADLHRYVGKVSLWLWAALGRSAAPLPDLDAALVDHGHDLLYGPLVAWLGSDVPADAVGAFRVLGGSRLDVERIGERPGRTVTRWLEDRLMIGADAWDPEWRPAQEALAGMVGEQYQPVTVHWARPAGGVAAAVLVGPVTGRVGERRVTIDEVPAGGTLTLHLVGVAADEIGLSGRRATLPGLELTVHGGGAFAAGDGTLLLTGISGPAELGFAPRPG